MNSLSSTVKPALIRAVATPPAPSPTSNTVGDALMHYLKLEGVTHVFGVPGGGLMNFLVNLKNNDQQIQYIVSRHESGAAYMADGYYRATGKLGVVVVTTGPGATNALTGTMNAHANGSAVLLLTGEVDQRFSGLGYLQEGDDSSLNINLIFGAATGYSNTIVTGLNAQTIIKQALRDALLIPRQAVHLSLPVNVTNEPIDSAALPSKVSAYRTNIKGTNTEDVKNAMAALLACKRPLLFLGNSCRHALQHPEPHSAEQPEPYKNLLLFVETYGIPVMTSADGKGIFPESHDLSLRVYGIADCMWPYYYLTATDPHEKDTPLYDGIMIIGSNLGELSTNSWLPLLVPQTANHCFIQVDANPKIIARSFEVTQAVVSEPGAFINQMAGFIADFPVDDAAVTERKAAIATIKEHSPFIDPDAYQSNSSPMEPAALMRVLQNTVCTHIKAEDTKHPGTKIFIDAGNCVGWAVHYLNIQWPNSIFTSLTMGPMGFGVCAVVGAKFGCPDHICIGIVGDGAFLMHGNEVSTASKYKMGVIWIVLYDNNLSMVSQGMNYFARDEKDPDVWTDLYELGNPDLMSYAKSMGADAYCVSSPPELEAIMPEVIEQAEVNNIPQVIIVNINRKSVPPYYNPIYSPAKK